jgi:hypothetical protein
MEKFITWKKAFFSRTYQFYSNGIEVGYLKISFWSKPCLGELDGKGFAFTTKGFFNRETKITDSKTGQEIAVITYNNWKSKATIKLTDESVCEWEYLNFWRTKWVLKKNLYTINYHGREMKGEIISYLDDEVLIVAGIFISSYFNRRSAAAASA